MTVDAVDNAHVLLDFGKGVYAVVTTGFTIQKYRCPAVELYGSDGTIQMLGDDWAPRGYEIWQNEVGAWQLYEDTDTHWPWTDGLRHMVECIQTGTRPLITPEHGYHVLEIMLSAQAAGKDGQARTLQAHLRHPASTMLARGMPPTAFTIARERTDDRRHARCWRRRNMMSLPRMPWGSTWEGQRPREGSSI